MEIKPFKEKSRRVLSSRARLIYLEGSVRSAKTLTANVKWYQRILNSPESVFLMSGNTQGSISRNVIQGDFGFIRLTGGVAEQHTDTDGSKYLLLPAPKGDPRKVIKIYYCGADNAASFKKVTGLTIGGWYADEFNLHDPEFIKVAFGRSLASKDPFNMGTLNPDVPGHFVYREYLDKWQNEHLPGFELYHFTLDDNPAITEERKAEIARQYTGIFYKRYILGLRCRAEGICYPSFSESCIWDTIPDDVQIKWVTFGSDIGGSDSATCYTATGYFYKDNKLCAVILDDLRDQDNYSTESILKNFVDFVKRVQAKYSAIDCYSDSAEQLIRKSMDNLGIVNVYNSIKKPIIDRIRFCDLAFSAGRLYILRRCKPTIESFQSAVYDPKAQKETRLDNFTINIDSIDAAEYSLEPYMEDFNL